jgi:hypothetical protein
MTTDNEGAAASILSEFLLYHAALGRGYIPPKIAGMALPPARALVFTSAIPSSVIFTFASAESQFYEWHSAQMLTIKNELRQLERSPESREDPNGLVARLKDRVSRRPSVTWKEDQVTKSTLVELLKRSFYGAMTYVDTYGGRLAASLCFPARLASDLTWLSLTEGTAEETLIRANASGGSCIHSLSGRNVVFNHFCRCASPETVVSLHDRIVDTTSAQVARGEVVLLPTQPAALTGVTADTLFDLMRRVYALGDIDADPEHRVRVLLEPGTEECWKSLLEWDEKAAADQQEDFTEWELSRLAKGPTSVRTAVLMGIRASIVEAFLDHVAMHRDGPVRSVYLNAQHLEHAKAFARLIFLKGSGLERIRGRKSGLKSGAAESQRHINDERLADALHCLKDAIGSSDNRRMSHFAIRSLRPTVTYGLLARLVSRGDIVELRGVEQCQMGKVTRAYALPVDAPYMEADEAVREFVDAYVDFDDSGYDLAAVFAVYHRLQDKAEMMDREEMLPVVPLSRMTTEELQMLPAVLHVMGINNVLLRGVGVTPEPRQLLDMEDCPLDVKGLNLWFRHRPSGEQFRGDWNAHSMLGLGAIWGGGNDE